MSVKYLFLNWKMFGSKYLVDNFCKNLNSLNFQDIEIVFFPPVIYLDLASRFAEKSFKLGVQDFSFYDKSNLTGDISFEMVNEFDISYAIVGHSERISSYNEEYSRLNLKLKLLHGKKINPIICFGENVKISEDDFGIFFSEFLLYISESLQGFSSDIFLAYEPVWAIGAGQIDDLSLVSKNISIIKKILLKHDFANIKLIYGGSVNESNISDLESSIEVDGYLVGSAGRDFNSIKNILKNVK